MGRSIQGRSAVALLALLCASWALIAVAPSAGAVGDMWRSSGWMAALVATTLLDQDPTRYRIAFDLGGRVDGPSAGALTTSGLLALLGDFGALRTDTTMTGTINPDGTVGPVGGIPLKVAGVAEAGFARFGTCLYVNIETSQHGIIDA